VLLGLTVSAVAVAVEPDGTEATPAVKKSNWNWLPWWSSAKTKEPDKKAKDAADKKAEPAAKKELLVDQSAAERLREEAALLRRLAVCDQLKLIATQNKDDTLLRQAEQIEQRAQAVYSQRVARLQGGVTGTETDEQILTKQAGKDTAGGGRLTQSS